MAQTIDVTADALIKTTHACWNQMCIISNHKGLATAASSFLKRIYTVSIHFFQVAIC